MVQGIDPTYLVSFTPWHIKSVIDLSDLTVSVDIFLAQGVDFQRIIGYK